MELSPALASKIVEHGVKPEKVDTKQFWVRILPGIHGTTIYNSFVVEAQSREEAFDKAIREYAKMAFPIHFEKMGNEDFHYSINELENERICPNKDGKVHPTIAQLLSNGRNKS